MLCIMPIPKDHDWFITVLAIIGKFFITMAFGIIYFYTNELFPTVIRATGMGTCGMMCRIGGIVAGWLGLLKQYHVFIPTTIYGVLSVFFAFLAMALPETKGEKIPDTMEEGEQGWNFNTFIASCFGSLQHRNRYHEGLFKCVELKPTEEAVHLEEHAKHVGGLQK